MALFAALAAIAVGAPGASADTPASSGKDACNYDGWSLYACLHLDYKGGRLHPQPRGHARLAPSRLEPARRMSYDDCNLAWRNRWFDTDDMVGYFG